MLVKHRPNLICHVFIPVDLQIKNHHETRLRNVQKLLNILGSVYTDRKQMRK